MGLGKCFGRGDNFVSCDFTPIVLVAGRKFLSVSDGSGRLKHIYDITVGRIEVERPASAETTGDGGRSAVVINDQRIFFGRIEIGRQIITSVDHRTFLILIVPVFHLSENNIPVLLFVGIRPESRLIIG